LTEHAFNRLNLIKLYAGQHEELWKWVNSLLLIGYRVEGLREKWGIRDGKNWCSILTSVEAEHFNKIKNERGGKIINGDPLVLQKKRSKYNFIPELKTLLKKFNDNQKRELDQIL
jgi:hypothetical protein